MKNHESEPQNHETGPQADEGCIFLFLREQLLLCGLVSELILETPWGVGRATGTLLSHLDPRLCCRDRQENPQQAPGCAVVAL